MKIRFNADTNFNGNKSLSSSMSSRMSTELRMFNDQITRLEVDLSHDYGIKHGTGEKRCLLEARFQSRKPIAVTNMADSYERAAEGAVVKMKALLITILGSQRNY